MTDVLEWFGLRPGASERDVKRAYARRLKDVRPDEDPVAFQELHERYQEALSWVQYAAPEEEIAEEGSATVTPFERRPEPVEEAHDIAADWHAFHDGLLQYVHAANGRDLHAWLLAQPALWSLETKAQFGGWVMHILRADDAPPMSKEIFDTLVDFFDQRDVASQWHTRYMDQARRRLDLAWRLLPANVSRLGATGIHGPDAALGREMLDALSKPRSLRTILRFGLSPYGPGDMVKFIDGLDGGSRDLPPPIREDEVAFWDRAADTKRLSWPRIGLMFTRLTIVAIVLSALFAIVGYARGIPWIFGLSFGVGVAMLVATTGVRAYFQWQARHEFDDTRWPALRLGWIPLLVGAGFGLQALTGSAAWTYSLVNLAYVTALFRYTRRNGAPPLIYGWMIYVVLFVLVYPPAGACVALILWLVDGWLHRRVLKWRRDPSPGLDLSR